LFSTGRLLHHPLASAAQLAKAQHQQLPDLLRHNAAKMSVVTLLGVNVMNNPSSFTDKYVFEVTFESLEALEKGLSLAPAHPTSSSSSPLHGC
jgi:hypothetical protein